MSYYAQISLNYNQKRTEQNLNKANDYILKAQKNSEDSQKYSSKAIEYANQAMSTVIPYDSKELKGVWIRPTYFNKKDIRLSRISFNDFYCIVIVLLLELLVFASS
jgi:hypothetical protein